MDRVLLSAFMDKDHPKPMMSALLLFQSRETTMLIKL